MNKPCDECGNPMESKRGMIYEPHDLKPRELCEDCNRKALVRLFGHQQPYNQARKRRGARRGDGK